MFFGFVVVGLGAHRYEENFAATSVRSSRPSFQAEARLSDAVAPERGRGAQPPVHLRPVALAVAPVRT